MASLPPTELIVPLSALLPKVAAEVEATRASGGWDVDQLRKVVRNWFDFLGPYTQVHILDPGPNGVEPAIVLAFAPPAGRDPLGGEARFRQATAAADKGNLAKALPLFQRLVEDFPEVAKYHRALGHAHLVREQFDQAEDELLRALALDGRDPDALTLLGNLYVRRGRHAEARPLYERSVQIAPNVYALTNLGAALAELGEVSLAVETLRRATATDPRYPNGWFGLGLALSRLQDMTKVPEAIGALDRTLEVAGSRTSNPVLWDRAATLLQQLSDIQSTAEVSAAEEVTRQIAEQEQTTFGVPVRIESGDVPGALAKIEYAWVHRRAFHRIVASSRPGPLREHQIRHEIEHLRLTNLARAAGKNRWFASNALTREHALRELGPDLTRMHRSGLPEAALATLSSRWVDGLLSQLYNFPLDLLIEQRLLTEHPQLHELIYQALRHQVMGAMQIAGNPEVAGTTPRKVFRANVVMNAVQALWFEAAFPRRLVAVAPFQRHESWPLAKRIWERWKVGAANWQPGDELDWVDQWADLLKLREWFLWHADEGEE